MPGTSLKNAFPTRRPSLSSSIAHGSIFPVVKEILLAGEDQKDLWLLVGCPRKEGQPRNVQQQAPCLGSSAAFGAGRIPWYPGLMGKSSMRPARGESAWSWTKMTLV